MLSPPKVHWQSDPYRTGSDSGIQGTLYGYEYSGLLVSEPHFKKRTGKVQTWSGGGPFYLYRKTLTHEGQMKVHVKKNTLDLGTFSVVGVIPNTQTLLPAPPVPPTYDSWANGLDAYYTAGYKRARPGNPVASLGQFLVELRDLPRLPFQKAFGWKNVIPSKGSRYLPIKNGYIPVQSVPRVLFDRLVDFRNLGSEYLNVAFGWKPFVNDLRKMYNLWKTIDSRMAQIVRENNKYIRRRATLVNEPTSTQSLTIYAFPYANVLGAPPNYMTGQSVYTVTTTTKHKVWFSGSFRYYIPDTSSSLWDARARACLFGALPTPELVWSVLPWSWLIDWFSNVSDVMSNASQNAVDNLTCRYSFIMEQTSTKVEARVNTFHSASTSPNDSWPAVQNSFVSTTLLETKLRRGGGNPFGLDVQLPSLSTYQLSILAALGLSRSSVR